MDDLIFRSAAIDALGEKPLAWTESEYEQGLQNQWEQDVDALMALPAAQRWIPVTSRPMTEDERREWSERLGYDIEYEDALIYTSQLPDDGQEVLVCTKYGRVYVDTFCNDEGCYFEGNGDMDGIVAWMPLPEPYKPKEEA